MDEKSELHALTNTASIAAGGCHPAGMAGDAIAAQPVSKRLSDCAAGLDVTLANTKRNGGTKKTCQHCGQEYETRRPGQSRYCGPRCRRLAWLARNPARAAELAAADKERLRRHLAGRGIAWQERGQP